MLLKMWDCSFPTWALWFNKKRKDLLPWELWCLPFLVFSFFSLITCCLSYICLQEHRHTQIDCTTIFKHFVFRHQSFAAWKSWCLNRIKKHIEEGGDTMTKHAVISSRYIKLANLLIIWFYFEIRYSAYSYTTVADCARAFTAKFVQSMPN